MKTLAQLLIILLTMSFISCKGPRGLPGLDGRPGEDGGIYLGTAFKLKGDFTADNQYSLLYKFPSSFEIYESDIVLVYILWEITNDQYEDEVWRLMPQTQIVDTRDGTAILQYNFDYTFHDVQVFLDGDVNFATLGPGDLENQYFRIVVLPVDFAEQANINNYNSIINSPELYINSIDIKLTK